MKQTITLLALMILPAMLKAQAIVYTDVQPDTTVTGWNYYMALGTDIWLHPGEVVSKTWGDVQLLCDNDTMPRALNMGDTISATSAKWSAAIYRCMNCGGMYGNWKGATNKYLGVRDKDASGNWKYGWIRISVPANPTSVTIKDYAMYASGSAPIVAGQVFATGVHDAHTVGNAIGAHVAGRVLTLQGLQVASMVTIHDMAGRVVYHHQLLQPNTTIDMSAHAAGLYAISVGNKWQKQVMKVAIH